MKHINLKTNAATLLQNVGDEDGIYVLCTSTALIQRKHRFFIFDGPMRRLTDINGNIVATFDVEGCPDVDYLITNLTSNIEIEMSRIADPASTLLDILEIIFREEFNQE